MLRVAMVEDEDAAASGLAEFIDRYAKESGEIFSVRRFRDAIEFLENYRPDYDMIFMDILLPELNGMDASKKLRELDRTVVLIFVTNMAQFAVRGYEVGALDFIVKPLSYYDFVMKMKRACFAVRSRDDKMLVIATAGGGSVRLPIRDLTYIEVSGHKCRYHTATGVYEGRNSLSKLAAALVEYDFMSCNNCYLVNPVHIKHVGGYTVTVAGDELQISHPKRKAFMRQFNEWISRGGGGVIT